MKKVSFHMMPEHGLQIEDTVEKNDREGVAHLARYWWTWTVLKSVFGNTQHVAWDLGCGCGYGSAIMAEQLSNRVVGIDADRKALLPAWRDYPDERIKFIEYHLEQHWRHAALAEAPQLIAAFDVFEQIRHRELFMEQLIERIAPNGIFLFSVQDPRREQCHATPNDGAYFRYNRPIIEGFMRRYFGTVRFGMDSHKTADDVFNYYTQLNPQLTAFVRTNEMGEPYTVGSDVVYCADPRK